MPTAQRYRTSPIVEAIIDIQFQPTEHSNPEKLEEFGASVGEKYPARQDISQVSSRLTTEGVVSTPLSVVGYRYDSTDRKYVIQVKAQSFTLSRLAPYESWEPFRDEARRLWERFVSIVKPARLTRAAVRYINQIPLPPPAVKLEDYFTTYPQISQQLPQDLQSFAMQVIMPIEKWGATLSLIHASLPITEKALPINLDIDIFKIVPDGFSSEDEAWTLLENLREQRNSVFEGCITDKTRELFGFVKG